MRATASSVPVSTSRMTLVRARSGMEAVWRIDGRLVAAPVGGFGTAAPREPGGVGFGRAMPDEPVGFDIDIGKILRDTGLTGTKRRRPSTTTADAAIRRAVRAELVGVERARKP